MTTSYVRAIAVAAMLGFGAFANAGDYTLDDVGDVVFLHGTTDNVAELGNIVGKLMKIEGVKEVRSNIFKK